MDQYRQQHIDFHTSRVNLFMVSARVIRNFMVLYGHSDKIQVVIDNLVFEARTENQIARWWKHMPEEQLQKQRDFWT